MITNDARHTSEIKPRIALVKATFDKKKILFTSKLKLVKTYTWSIAVYGTETWALTTCKSAIS
jgi:hypothetical protein